MKRQRQSFITVVRNVVLLSLLAFSIPILWQPQKVAAVNEKANIGMPFTGKWAYNVHVNPPYTDSNSSHPSVHPIYGTGANWSTDIYAPAGTDVEFKVSGNTGTLSYTWASSSTSCGQSTRINISDNGVAVGNFYVAHISNAVTSGTITNGMKLGDVANLGCNPGQHVHVEFASSINPSCYTDHGNPGITLNSGTSLGILGTTSATGNRQACPTAPPDSDGDGFPDSSDQCPYTYGTLNGCPDFDGDGIADSSDWCYLLAGPVWNGGCPEEPQVANGDINGDGYDDAISLYNDGNNTIRFWLLPGQSNGTFGTPSEAYYNSTWSWTATKLSVGDVNGDGYDDIVAMYDYGSSTIRFLVLPGQSNGSLGTAIEGYYSGAGNWAWGSTKFVVGKFNNDSYDDIMALYDYGSSTIRFWFLAGQSNGTFGTPSQAYYNSTWSWAATKLTATNVNGDSYDDTVSLYDDGNSNIRFLTLPGQSNGSLGTAITSYTSCSGCWAWDATKLTTANVNNDTYGDVIALYDYGGSNIKFLNLPGSSNGTLGTAIEAYVNSTWHWASTKLR